MMIEKCYAHGPINAKGEPFPNEALLVSLVFSQYQMINWLVPKIARAEQTNPRLENSESSMTSVAGWLFDVYPQGDKMVFWIKRGRQDY